MRNVFIETRKKQERERHVGGKVVKNLSVESKWS